MRVIDRHHCTKRHRNARVYLHCAIPALATVTGEGQLALVLWCGVPRAVLLKRLSWARTVEAEYRVFGCGPDCIGEHELLAVDFDSNVMKEAAHGAQ